MGVGVGAGVGMAAPKQNAGCLQFPPPPDYPPPAATSPLHKSAGSSPIAVAAIVSSSLGSCVGVASGMAVNGNGRRQLLPRYPDPDPDAIEICNEQPDLTPHHQLNQVIGRQSKTLGRDGSETAAVKWNALQPASSLNHMHHQQHDYSYAYYEPGAAMRHSNVPKPEGGGAAGGSAGANASCCTAAQSQAQAQAGPPPPNSIRALLSKGKKNKQLVSPATLQSYQTRYHKLTTASSQSENFYEEINAAALQSSAATGKTLAQPQPRSQPQQLGCSVGSHSAGSLSQTLVEEELRRVQHRHHKILGELNLSVEAMLMPESPPKCSPPAVTAVVSAAGGSGTSPKPSPTVCVTATSGQPAVLARLTSTSADNICDSSDRATAGGYDEAQIAAVGGASNSSILARASCGRRILSCARIRAAEDPGPSVPTESKARSFWNRKGWRKLPGFSTSTSSINDTGLSDKHDSSSSSSSSSISSSIRAPDAGPVLCQAEHNK
ncbi:uncharacterized protein DDB_G0271670-like [Drosophila novamexicana]|uniref:uncharacterized protein DDB_G0271670-like n=1 Tax=Drosophila novamexicana TaxID=47314 RepID=UPI0011E5BC05|nr:uncharacterized protein DDB_G0271670-like [Drosophila novamexicana]